MKLWWLQFVLPICLLVQPKFSTIFFLNTCRYWTYFLVCESTIMSYRSSLLMVPFHSFDFFENIHRNNSFPHFYPHCLLVLRLTLVNDSCLISHSKFEYRLFFFFLIQRCVMEKNIYPSDFYGSKSVYTHFFKYFLFEVQCRGSWSMWMWSLRCLTVQSKNQVWSSYHSSWSTAIWFFSIKKNTSLADNFIKKWWNW